MSVIWTFFFGAIPYNTGTKYFKYNSLVTNIQKTLGFAGHYECDLDFFSLVPFHTTQAQNIQKTLGFAGLGVICQQVKKNTYTIPRRSNRASTVYVLVS